MDLKYTNRIENGVAIMRLYDEIGQNHQYFVEEMGWHNMLGNKIVVHINSPGGSVFGGYGIIQAILDYEADTHIVGLAASMAGVIAQFGKKRTANDFAVGMIHLPSYNGKKPKGDPLLGIIAKSLLDILESRCKIPRAELEAKVAEETFMDASTMLEMGFIDEIVKTNVASVKNISNFTPCDLYNYYNSLLTDTEMNKIKAHFQLADSVTEDMILGKITDLENTIAAQTTAVEAAKPLATELEALKTQNAALLGTIAENIVDKAIAEGKVDKSKKAIWVEAAKKDHEGVKAQLDSIAVQSLESIKSLLEGQGAPTTKKPEDDIVAFIRSDAGAKKMIELQNSNKAEYDRLWSLYEATF